MNIILNAAQAMNGKGKLILETYWVTAKEQVGIEISDTGPGIATDVIPHIFDPFYTTKEEGQGTGLGLSLAYGIVENHGGRISVRNRSVGGAAFSIVLPIATAENEGDQSDEN
jgi:signal transduction histidine kinase